MSDQPKETGIVNLGDVTIHDLNGDRTERHWPWLGAIRAVNHLTGEMVGGLPVWNHRLEQYHEDGWKKIPVYEELEDGKLKGQDDE